MSEDLNNLYGDTIREAIFVYTKDHPGADLPDDFILDSQVEMKYLVLLFDHCVDDEEYGIAQRLLGCIRDINTKNSIMPQEALEFMVRKALNGNLGRWIGLIDRDYFQGKLEDLPEDTRGLMKFNNLFKVIDQGKLFDILMGIRDRYPRT